MPVTTEKDGTQVYTVNRTNKADLKVQTETVYSSKIKAIHLPLAFSIKDHKSKKYQEIMCCFSVLKDKEDHSAQIKKTITFLYKYGRYASYTHLIPMPPKHVNQGKSVESVKIKQFAITTGSTPATATYSENINLFPCYEDVLPTMLEYFSYPDFYITLLPESAVLNVKRGKKCYERIPLLHVNGHCFNGHGHSHIHIEEKTISSISFLRQIKWDKLEFEEDEMNGLDVFNNPTF